MDEAEGSLKPVAHCLRQYHEVVSTESGNVHRDGVLGVTDVAVVVGRHQLRFAREMKGETQKAKKKRERIKWKTNTINNIQTHRKNK